MLRIIGWVLFFVLEIPCAGLFIYAAYTNPKHLPMKVNGWFWAVGIDWMLMILAIAFAAFVEPHLRKRQS